MWNVESDVVFGSKKEEFEKYNTIIEVKQVSKEVGLD
jgi:hypothetical protein